MGVSVDYNWVHGSGSDRDDCFWEIKNDRGAVFRLGVDLRQGSGTLQTFAPFRPEDKPFVSRLHQVDTAGNPEPLSDWTAMH